MNGRTQTCTVKDGRIRFICPRCDKKQFLAVSQGLRRKLVRCSCGQTVQFHLNHRMTARESISSKAFVILDSGRECPVYLCDISPSGIGFNVPAQYSRLIGNVRELRVKYRGSSGSMVVRRVSIKSLANNRIGAEFLDGKIPSF